MTEKLKINLIEFLAIILTIASVPFMINSIIVNGFGLNPIDTGIGLMIIFFMLFLRNFFSSDNSINSLRILNGDDIELTNWIIYILQLLILDIAFYLVIFMS